MSTRQKRYLVLCATCGAVIAVVFWLGGARERYWFLRLKMERQSTEAARVYASRLMETRRGVDMALSDADIYGGSNRGWSEWILIHSSRDAQITSRLTATLANQGVNVEKRLMAAFVLYNRTKQVIFLEKAFSILQRPGSEATRMGRGYFASKYLPGEIGSRIRDTPPDQTVGLRWDDVLKRMHPPASEPEHLR